MPQAQFCILNTTGFPGNFLIYVSIFFLIIPNAHIIKGITIVNSIITKNNFF